ncbi:MAG: hypothetical protein CMH41_00910 [Micrococcales bacterium]|nr:hypothetical protein [Micrococcales bacterium]
MPFTYQILGPRRCASSLSCCHNGDVNLVEVKQNVMLLEDFIKHQSIGFSATGFPTILISEIGAGASVRA